MEDTKRYIKCKKAGKILSFISFPILALINFIFVFTNFRSLISGDFNAYSSPASGALSLIFNVLSYGFIVAFSIILIVHHAKKSEEKDTTFVLTLSVAYVVIALINSFFYAFNKAHGLVAIIEILNLLFYVVCLIALGLYFIYDYHLKKKDVIEEPKEDKETETIEEEKNED